jgi:hypothetical protein
MEFFMLKRTVARLLLFGIPFTMAYYGARPAPAKSVPTFVICDFPEGSDTGRTIVVAETFSACSELEDRSQNNATQGVIRPAVRMSSEDRNKNIRHEPLQFSF